MSIENGKDVQPLSAEEFNELKTKLWEIFRCHGQQHIFRENANAAATAALGIIQLQTLKPPGME